MNFRSMLTMFLCAAVMIGGAIGGRAQQPAAPERPKVVTEETQAADQQIVAEIKDHSEIMANLEYLSDMIGQRLTGSANLKKANDWTKEKFAGYGLTNAHLESWQIAHTWTRGTATGRITSPAEHPLSLAAYAWMRGEGNPKWSRHLAINVGHHFRQSLNYLNHGGQTALRQLVSTKP